MTTEFTVDVDGVGAFTFAQRTMRHELRIQAEYSRLTEGVDTPTAALDLLAGIVSTLKVLTVRGPAGWNIDAMDPLDDDSYARMMKVHTALRAKEGSFRRAAKQADAAGGAGDGRQSGVLVPPALPAAAD